MLAIGEQIMKNGELIPKLNFNLPLSSEATEVYEIIRVDSGKVLFFDDHLKRLIHTLESIDIKNSNFIEDVKESVQLLIDTLKLTNNNIRISIFKFINNHVETIVNAIPTVYPNEQMYKYGVQTGLLSAERTKPDIKKGHTKVRKLANDFIKENHIYEAILVNHHDCITEGSKSNIFLIKDNTLYTAPDNTVLQGIMRSKVITEAEKSDIEIVYETIHINQLHNFEAAFITGTSPRVLPIKAIDDNTFNTKHHIIKVLTEAIAVLIAKQ